MTDDRVCDLGNCRCADDFERNNCPHFHMPMPRMISSRTTKQSDFVDRGLHQITQQNEKIRDSRADLKRKLPRKR